MSEPASFQPSNAWEDHQAGHMAAQTRYLGQIAKSVETIRTILVVFTILFVIGVVLFALEQ